MSMASPRTVPTAAPVSIPPFMAEVITSRSAKKRPRDTASKSTTRSRAMSIQEAITMRETLCLSSAVSELLSAPSRASRKK